MAKIGEEGTDAERSTAVYVKPEIPGEYSATLDKKCAGFAPADRTGDCREFPFSQTSANQETKGKSRDSERAAGFAILSLMSATANVARSTGGANARDTV
jgi:hypothetical protein